MDISFYLKRPDADTDTTLFARISYDGFKLKHYIPEKINPKFWNSNTQRAKETEKFKGYPEFNTRVNNIKKDIQDVYRTFVNDSGTIPNPETLKELLQIKINKKEPDNKQIKTFFGFFEGIINQSKTGIRLHPKTGKPINKNTIKTYVTTFRHLTNFQKTIKKKIDFENINLDFYSDYKEYLIKTGVKLNPKTGKQIPLNLSTNSVGKHIQIIKLVMNDATERGLNSNLSFKSKRFVTVREKTDNIYLTANEIKEIELLNLTNNPRLEKVRDLFLIGCHTGLRYSDYSILKPENIKEGFIETTQIKTGEPVVIPIHNTVKKIIEKYNGILPTSISNQKTNEYLKQVGKLLPSLQKTFTQTFTKGGFKVIENKCKWELLTTHTGRRSFASNEYLAGMPALTIMAITGHKTEKAFLRYIKLTPNEHAKLMQAHWKNRNILHAV